MLRHSVNDVRCSARAHESSCKDGKVISPFVTLNREVPPDMFVTLHTLVYASYRAHIDELQTIGQQITSAYGKEFAKQSETDEKCINDTIRQNINLIMPEEGWKVARLLDIAKEEGINYTPTEKSNAVGFSNEDERLNVGL